MIGSKRLKIVVCVIAVLCCAVYLTGCAAVATSPVLGAIYTDVKAPLAVGSPGSGADVLKGEATAVSVLGLIAIGNASIRMAALAGGITEIHYVDYHSENFLGIYAKFTVTVYGKKVETPSDNAQVDVEKGERLKIKDANPDRVDTNPSYSDLMRAMDANDHTYSDLIRAMDANEYKNLLNRVTELRTGLEFPRDTFAVDRKRGVLLAHMSDGHGVLITNEQRIMVPGRMKLAWLTCEKRGNLWILTHYEPFRPVEPDKVEPSR